MAIEQEEFDSYRDLSDLEFEGLMEFEESLRGLNYYLRREYWWETETLDMEVFHKHYTRELAKIQPTRQRFVLRQGNGGLVKMPDKQAHDSVPEELRTPPAHILRAPVITPDAFESYAEPISRLNGFCEPSQYSIPRSLFELRETARLIIE